MTHTLLILNTGSSSLRFALYTLSPGTAPARRLRGLIENIGEKPRLLAWNNTGQPLTDQDIHLLGNHRQTHDRLLPILLDWIDEQAGDQPLLAIGHRIVHGGNHYTAPVLVDAEVLSRLEALAPLAPQHQAQSLAALHTLADRHPNLPQVACFDTAFHSHQPAVARSFALPRTLTDSGIRRYGFHGLSCESITEQLPRHLDEAARNRVVICHLGSGSSLCALHQGRSLASTMGFSTLDGLPMSTRCGTLDPGVVLHLLTQKAMSAEQISHLLHHQSGLLGVSGISGDMLTLLHSRDPRAAEAIDLYVYRVNRELGSMAAALGGLDALVFTGGVGEHAAVVRDKISRAAAWLGLEIDREANLAGATCISRPGSRVATLVLPADEESVIARHTVRLLATPVACAA